MCGCEYCKQVEESRARRVGVKAEQQLRASRKARLESERAASERAARLVKEQLFIDLPPDAAKTGKIIPQTEQEQEMKNITRITNEKGRTVGSINLDTADRYVLDVTGEGTLYKSPQGFWVGYNSAYGRLEPVNKHDVQATLRANRYFTVVEREFGALVDEDYLAPGAVEDDDTSAK